MTAKKTDGVREQGSAGEMQHQRQDLPTQMQHQATQQVQQEQQQQQGQQGPAVELTRRQVWERSIGWQSLDGYARSVAEKVYESEILRQS